jgi:hypothetical protein
MSKFASTKVPTAVYCKINATNFMVLTDCLHKNRIKNMFKLLPTTLDKKKSLLIKKTKNRPTYTLQSSLLCIESM